jgi:hypothetical protein
MTQIKKKQYLLTMVGIRSKSTEGPRNVKYFLPLIYVSHRKLNCIKQLQSLQLTSSTLRTLIKRFRLYTEEAMLIPVAARSKVHTAWPLGSQFRIPLGAWIYAHVFLCYAVLFRQSPPDGPIPLSRKITKMSERFHSFRN